MPDSFSADEKVLLSPYVTNVDRPIYALGNLPEEVVAVLFAYYSRSTESLRRNLLKLIRDQEVDLDRRLQWIEQDSGALAEAKEKARQFHEKWVVGYGHSSVAEHAVVHLALEEVSILATKIIEDNRLASYTEKSTRYVIFDPRSYYTPARLQESSCREIYERTVTALLSCYHTLMEETIAAVQARWPRQEGKTEAAYKAACRAKSCDILRYLLPAATQTNLGLTINGRALEYMISKLLSHPLEEIQGIGQAVKEEAQKIVPTLIKYAAPSPYRMETEQVMREMAQEFSGTTSPQEDRTVRLVAAPEDAEKRLVAAILYSYGSSSYAQLTDRVSLLSPQERERVIDEYLKGRGPHDPPLRALEDLVYSFEILVDFGAFRDIQRHRMATQHLQEFTADHGYVVPPEVAELGLETHFEASMEQAREAYGMIRRKHPLEAAYVLPLAYRRRVLFTWNLREMFHFVQLRSARQGHASYRSVAQEVYRELERVHPLLARYMRVDLEEYPLGRL
ncbi:MAG: FAD-dependent thymidylate synthase [Candidatus Tectomicrobia bacterium]|uniref:FAD-dependent thymidylate synthase n=1 Tax=Tectimicrobiota bacterium TaxID=2528274 RepID=A0A932M0N9_UNCTE|nr:FAD-dependent thymidylate synthase [Candidatus Tectomicrobia bacterium]